jgi:hypothetical protein
MTHDGITNGIRVALLATVALWATPGHADWRKTTLTTGNAFKDAQYDFKNLRTKRPNDPPPTQAGKLDGGIKIEHEPGSIIYRIDMYPNYVARIQLEKWYKDVQRQQQQQQLIVSAWAWATVPRSVQSRT